MPRAPLLGGLSPQVTGGLSPKQLLPLNLSVIFADARCHLSGLRLPAVASCKCTRTLLAAAPTTPPCFRHWRRSSSLPSRGAVTAKPVTERLDKGQANRLHGQVLTPRRGGACSASGPHRQWQRWPALQCKVHCPAQRPCRAQHCWYYGKQWSH